MQKQKLDMKFSLRGIRQKLASSDTLLILWTEPFVGKLLSTEYFTAELIAFQFYPVCNFGKFISFDLALSRVESLMS